MAGRSFYQGDYVHVTKRNTNGDFLVNAYGELVKWKYGKSSNILWLVRFEYGKFKNQEDWFYATRMTHSSRDEAIKKSGGKKFDPKVEDDTQDNKPETKTDADKILKSLIYALDLAVDAEHRWAKAEDHELPAAEKARDEADARLRNELDKARALSTN